MPKKILRVLTPVKGLPALLLEIREIAKKEGIAVLSEKTGIPRRHLYSILSTKGNPTMESVIKICDALKIEQRFEVRG